MSSYSAQLREEQQAVSRAYGRLDDLRTQARARLDTVRAAGSHGSPTQRTERDSFATMYEDRLTQLRAVEDRLVFGRLDDVHGAHRYIGRIGLSNENHEPILTDWRADAARPFYEATPSNHGDIVMRRHITLSFREVVGVEDEVLDVHSDQVGQASSDGTLTGAARIVERQAHRQDDRYRGNHPSRAGSHYSRRPQPGRGGAGWTGYRQNRRGAAPCGISALHASANARTLRCARGRTELNLPALHRSGAPLPRRDRSGQPNHRRSDPRRDRDGA